MEVRNWDAKGAGRRKARRGGGRHWVSRVVGTKEVQGCACCLVKAKGISKCCKKMRNRDTRGGGGKAGGGTLGESCCLHKGGAGLSVLSGKDDGHQASAVWRYATGMRGWGGPAQQSVLQLF